MIKKIFSMMTIGWLLIANSVANDQTLNIYCWYEYIPKALIAQFEQETGIKVKIDYYDNNQNLEIHLLTRSTGYDIVFPSSHPYMARQVKKGLYQKLDKSKLPNLRHLDPRILKFLETADPNHEFAVPYLWGITGIAYNANRLKEIMPNAPTDSWAILYREEIVKQFAPHGVYLLDEAIDVFTTSLAYLGLDPHSEEKASWQQAFNSLKTIRPFIRRFDSHRGHQDLINGEVVLIQSWSGDIALARLRAREAGKNIPIAFSVPIEGSSIAIDVMAIPQNAPNPDAAHQFINFVMRPEIIAMATNELGYSNANKDSRPFVDDFLRNDPNIFPDDHIFKRLFIYTTHSLKQYRYINRLMLKLKTWK